MADNLQKRPAKGILKNSSSFDKQDIHPNAKKAKETKWDEMNIIATLHPADKDYGHMKIDEPKTPYNYETDDMEDQMDGRGLDPNTLAEKIKSGVSKLPKAMQPPSDESEDEDLTPEERQKKKMFEKRRKEHYNEFQAVKLARKLLEEEDEDDSRSQSPVNSGKSSPSSGSPSPQRKQSPSPTSKGKKT